MIFWIALGVIAVLVILVAIVTQFFLGFGYAESSSTTVDSISYIQQASDGGSTLHKVDIDDAVIYEDLAAGEEPYVEVWATVGRTSGPWIPWPVDSIPYDIEYCFHIPAGSIYEEYEVRA